jgi:hypothetical protein
MGASETLVQRLDALDRFQVQLLDPDPPRLGRPLARWEPPTFMDEEVVGFEA